MQIPFYERPFIFGLIAFFVTLVSCDDEISDVGSGVLSGTEIVITDSITTNISTSQISTNSTRANNLNYNLLGRFPGNPGDTNPYIANHHILGQVFGVTNLFVETETSPSDDDGNILSVRTTTYTLDDIKLVIPFRYSLDNDASNDEDEATYDIVSGISTGESGMINLQVYKSNFKLERINVNSTDQQVQSYFSDGSFNLTSTSTITSSSISNPNDIISLNGDGENATVGVYTYNLSEIESSFTVPTDGILESDEIAHAVEQAIRIPLSNSFKDSLIELMTNEDGKIDLTELSEGTVTTELQGVFIQIQDTSTGVVEVMEFGESLVPPGIEMTFTKTSSVNFTDPNEIDTVQTETVYSTFQMNTSNGRVVNLIDANVETEDTADEETILLRSGRASVGLVKIFDNLEELNDLAGNNILLNDAELILTLNQESPFFNENNFPVILEEGEEVPDSSDDETEAIDYSNIMVTDLNTSSVLPDYSTNLLSEDSDPTTSLQQTHLIPLQELNGELVYRINITQYLSNILDRDAIEEGEDLEDLIDAENLSLIISPTNDITLTAITQVGEAGIEESITDEDVFVNQGAVLSFKTIPIYSSNVEDENKKPRIIYKYTSTQ